MASFLHTVPLLLVMCCALAAAVLSGREGTYHLDPEVNMDAIQLITSKGFPAETHYVTTKDGYNLAMHRIPHGKNMPANVPRPVVFLQHGLLCSSTNWLTNLETESFAYILAQEGFDVWMGNVRGNTYCRNHTSLKPNERAFWDFSFDQHALIDLPYMLNRALNISGQDQLFYVGHSQGTVMGFAGFTVDKELAKKVKAFFALAPVTTVRYISGLFYVISEFYKEVEIIFDIFGDGEFLPNDELIDWLGKYVCTADMDLEEVCGDVIFLICGFDKANLNISRLPVYYTHTPAGSSVKNCAHFSQEVHSGKFEMYDYGSAKENERHYGGLPHPPPYNVSELTVPTALYTGGKDWLADPKDVEGLVPLIKNVTFAHKKLPSYDHLDFIWGENAAKDVYADIIGHIKRMV